MIIGEIEAFAVRGANDVVGCDDDRVADGLDMLQ